MNRNIGSEDHSDYQSIGQPKQTTSNNCNWQQHKHEQLQAYLADLEKKGVGKEKIFSGTKKYA